MKTTFFLGIILLCFFALTACGGDSEVFVNCENTICLNAGICTDGTCECPEGFTGIHCEIPIYQKHYVSKIIDSTTANPAILYELQYDESKNIGKYTNNQDVSSPMSASFIYNSATGLVQRSCTYNNDLGTVFSSYNVTNNAQKWVKTEYGNQNDTIFYQYADSLLTNIDKYSRLSTSGNIENISLVYDANKANIETMYKRKAYWQNGVGADFTTSFEVEYYSDKVNKGNIDWARFFLHLPWDFPSGKKNKHLPKRIVEQQGTTKKTTLISYTFNAEGYVTSVELAYTHAPYTQKWGVVWQD